MGAYIVRRLVAMVLMLVTLSMITFLLFNALPADPALPEQYSAFVKGIFVGRTYGSGTATFECDAPCLGYSFRKQAEVTDLIVDRLPVTGQLALGAFVIWIVVGVSVGVVAALKRGKWQDRTIMGAALTGYSFPSFFIALLLIFFVQLQLQLIPFVSYTSLVDDPVAWFQAFILPWVALAMLYAAFYARLTRNQMIETMGEDYIRTARAKGLRERTVIGKHGLRAGLTPIVTAAGIDLSGLLGGAVITESVFNLPGLGKLSIDSVLDADLPVITAVVLVAATFVIVANLVVDLLYAVIDPRVRLT